MSRLFKKSLIPMHSVIYFRPCRFHAQVAMTSIVDSEAHYERRMREMGMTHAGSTVILRSGLNTYGKLAFAHGQPGVALDEAAFNLFAQATLGAMANLGDTAVLKRLLFESHTLVLAQLKRQVTDPDGSSSRKMPPVEREARMENLKLRLPGVVIQRQMEPSHSLLDLCIQQWETRQLKFLSPEKCTSRQWEIEMSKGPKQIELDSDKLLVKEKSDVPDCVAHTELQTFEALRRRGIALAFADVVSWESREAYLMALFANLQKSPPQNYVKPTLQQVLRADRAVFTKLIQDGTPVRRAADGTLPLDTALIAALNHPDAAYHLMPLPKPASAPPKADPPKNEFRYNDQWDNHRYSTWERTSFHKRKGKGKGKGKSRDRYNVLPKALQGRDNVSTDQHNRRLCFAFQFNRCDKAAHGAQCPNGWHLCTRRGCHAPHPEQEHDASEGKDAKK